MIDRLIELGFSSAEIVARQRGRVVVRVRHPSRGWMYEKLAEDDFAALEAWAASVNPTDPDSSVSPADPKPERQQLDANSPATGEQP
jgi:cytochrome c553